MMRSYGLKRNDKMRLQVKKRKTELAQYETVDCGKPIVEAEADMVRLTIYHHILPSIKIVVYTAHPTCLS